MQRRWMGWGLVLYGVAGLFLVAVSAIVGLEAAARIERLSTAADGTLSAAVRSTEAAATAFANADGSLGEAEASAGGAAVLARDASTTLASLGQAMELSIFGAQPLVSLADDFDASADQATALGDALDGVGASLAGTRADTGRIGDELSTLGDELALLRDANGAGGSAPPLRLLVLLLLGWLLMPTVAGLIAGIALLRSTKPVSRRGA